MKILVIDVAAEYGGAKTVLENFLKEFKNDSTNDYVVVVSKLNYANESNIKFVRLKWVKKSYLHRLYFDYFFIRTIVEKYKPDKIISLQNKTVLIRKIPQEVFYHNALPLADKQYTLLEDKQLWLYQNVIGNIYRRSLKRAKIIMVQTEWMKMALKHKWSINESRVIVKPPAISLPKEHALFSKATCFFYPANGAIYKNHNALLKALIKVWHSFPELKIFPLILTGSLSDLPKSVQLLIRNKEYPVKFVGQLPYDKMIEQYSCSILVFPSFIETVGLPLLEAKCVGCPIIVADCDYSHEILDGYDRVRYFNPNSPSELKDRLIEAIRNNEIQSS